MLSSCGAKNDSSYGASTGSSSGGGSSANRPGDSNQVGSVPAPSAAPGYDDGYDYQGKGEGFDAVPVSDSDSAANMAEKIIYTVYAEIETIRFDETILKVEALLAANNGFIENKYIGGRSYAQSYYGLQTYRTASYTLRVPKDRLNAVTASLDTLGNVTTTRTDAENITSQFYDTQSRLNSYKTQEERLLDMMSRADNIPDMIAIEQRLSDVRYSIESLTTTLKHWQGQVDYSTVTLFVREVETLTEFTPIHRSYWQQIGDGLTSTLRGVGTFFKNLFKGIIVALPVLIIIAAVAIVCIILIRRAVRKKKARDNRAGRWQINPKTNQWEWREAADSPVTVAKTEESNDA